MTHGVRPLKDLTMEVRSEHDVITLRQRIRLLMAQLGFAAPAQTYVATAVSEIARNAVLYAGRGRVDFAVEPGRSERGGADCLSVLVEDCGRGIAELPSILAGKVVAGQDPALGIRGAQRLVDDFEISTSSAGTQVRLRQYLPKHTEPLTSVALAQLVEEVLRQPERGPMEELQAQNRELIRAVEEARLREEELARVNQELAQTNTGVLALYDELETLHRIGTTLASKLELHPLIQSIMDVTVPLTDADLGAFFVCDEKTGRWSLYARAGHAYAALDSVTETLHESYFGESPGADGLMHMRDLLDPELECTEIPFIRELKQRMAIRSCLRVPVVDQQEKLLGMMCFVSVRPHVFTERSERILASVATQAVVGIEKAQLFQSVTAANEAKDQFLAMLSHELRTPLNPAMAIISSLQSDARVPEELREELNVVWRNIRLEARLIDDLLDFNRLVKGKLQLRSETVNVHDLLNSVIDICREEFAGKAQNVTQHWEAAEPHVLGDAARLQQVFWNLLKNAIKFTPPNGSIEVHTQQRGATLRIDFIDNGRGIEPDSLDRIFSAFDQGQSQNIGHFGGLGLGLSIARMFVGLHGGQISAHSEGLGKGARLTIELPLAPIPQRARQQQPAPQASLGTGLSARVLLVDDHPDTLRTLQRLLTNRGFLVTVAASCAEARRALVSGDFDVMISDLGLPDCSGIDLLRDVRETHHFPAIAMSGYGMESDLENTKNAGFQAHLTKPVDFDELLRVVRAVTAKE